MDKELTGCLHLKTCSQLFNVQVETSDEWRPQGAPLVLGPALFNIFVSVFGSGTECTFSKFANSTKLCGVNMEREGCHPGGPGHA